MKSSSQRYPGLDVLRALAAFTVVLIHTPVSAQNTLKPMLLALFPSANAVFAVMAGMFLVNKLKTEVSFFDWLKVRINRLAAPYIFWVWVYLCLNIGFDLLGGNPLNCNFMSLNWWVGILFCGSGTVQLWFIVTLLYSQVALFLLWRSLRIFLNEKVIFILMSCLGAIVLNIYPLIDTGLYLRRLAFMFGYLLFGALIVGVDPVLVKHRKIVLWGGTTLLFTSLCATLCRLKLPYNLRVLEVVLWVVVARSAMPVHVPDFILSIGQHSMFIYLVHIVFTTLVPLLFDAIGIACPEGFSFLYVTASAFVLSWHSALLLTKFKRHGFFRKYIEYWIGV